MPAPSAPAGPSRGPRPGWFRLAARLVRAIALTPRHPCPPVRRPAVYHAARRGPRTRSRPSSTTGTPLMSGRSPGAQERRRPSVHVGYPNTRRCGSLIVRNRRCLERGPVTGSRGASTPSWSVRFDRSGPTRRCRQARPPRGVVGDTPQAGRADRGRLGDTRRRPAVSPRADGGRPTVIATGSRAGVSPHGVRVHPVASGSSARALPGPVSPRERRRAADD